MGQANSRRENEPERRRRHTILDGAAIMSNRAKRINGLRRLEAEDFGGFATHQFLQNGSTSSRGCCLQFLAPMTRFDRGIARLRNVWVKLRLESDK